MWKKFTTYAHKNRGGSQENSSSLGYLSEGISTKKGEVSTH